MKRNGQYYYALSCAAVFFAAVLVVTTTVRGSPSSVSEDTVTCADAGVSCNEGSNDPSVYEMQNSQDVTVADYGVDVSWPIHHGQVSTNYAWLPHNVDPEHHETPAEFLDMPIQPLGNRAKIYEGACSNMNSGLHASPQQTLYVLHYLQFLLVHKSYSFSLCLPHSMYWLCCVVVHTCFMIHRLYEWMSGMVWSAWKKM
jgi:hypothetical protein